MDAPTTRTQHIAPPSRFINRKDAIAALILAGLALFSWFPRLKGPINLRADGSAYYVLGTALAQGKGYRLLNEPGEIQTTLHPPMLPVIIALHQLALRTDDLIIVGQWLRRCYLIFFVAYIVAAYMMLRAFLPLESAFLATLVCLINFYTIFTSDLCHTETPFGLATSLFMLCTLRLSAGARNLFGAPLAIVSYALRTAGVAVFAAWVTESVCERRFKQAALRLLVSLVPILCWMAYIHRVESGREYRSPAYEYQRADYVYTNVSYVRNLSLKDSFSPELGYASSRDFVKRFVSNLSFVPTRLGETVSVTENVWEFLRKTFNDRVGLEVIPPWTVKLLLYLFGSLVLGGLGLQLARRHYLIPLYILFSLAALCTTPWPIQFNRYIVPLAPFLSLSLFLSLGAIKDWFPSLYLKGRKIALVFTGLVVLLILGSQAVTLFALYTKWHQKVSFEVEAGRKVEYRLFFYRNEYSVMDAGLDWLRSQSNGDGVVAATDPQWAYLRTGLKAVLPPLELDAAEAQRLLDSVPVKYLMVDESVYKKYTARVVAAYPDCWRPIYADLIAANDGERGEGKFEIYERVGQE